MKVYSYRLDHDFGLAPNPFGGYCTLVVCKPQIRKSKNLNLGDWIIGTGSKALDKTTGRKLDNSLIYAMKVTERMPIEEYWLDKRFEYKKPLMSSSLVNMFGDNFYYKSPKGEWQQIDCAHRNPDCSINPKHIKTDLRGINAFISDNYYYFGDGALEIPLRFKNVIHSTQGHKIVNPEKLGIDFIAWIEQNNEPGIHGDPLDWIIFRQSTLNFLPE